MPNHILIHHIKKVETILYTAIYISPLSSQILHTFSHMLANIPFCNKGFSTMLTAIFHIMVVTYDVSSQLRFGAKIFLTFVTLEFPQPKMVEDMYFHIILASKPLTTMATFVFAQVPFLNMCENMAK